MSFDAIIPSPESGYVEMASGTGTARFKKHLLTINTTLLHPATKQPIPLDEQFWQQLKRNWDNGVAGECAVPLATAANAHTEDPLANTGKITDLVREGNKVYTVVEIRKPDVAQAIRDGRIMGASAMLNLNYTDNSSGQKVGATLLHHCLTNRPYLTDLEPYEELVAATSSGSEEVLMLTNAAVAGDTDLGIMDLAGAITELHQALTEVKASQAQDNSVSLSTREMPTPAGALDPMYRAETASSRPASRHTFDYDDLEKRMKRFIGLAGWTGDSELKTQHGGSAGDAAEVARYLNLAARPVQDHGLGHGKVRELPEASFSRPLTDLRNEVEARARERGQGYDPLQLSAALDDIAGRWVVALNEQHQGLGDELMASMVQGDRDDYVALTGDRDFTGLRELVAAGTAHEAGFLQLSAQDIAVNVEHYLTGGFRPDGSAYGMSDRPSLTLQLAAADDGNFGLASDGPTGGYSVADEEAHEIADNRRYAQMFARKCSSCQQPKPEDSFPSRSSRQCKSCAHGAMTVRQDVTRPGGPTHTPAQGGDATVQRYLDMQAAMVRPAAGHERPVPSSRTSGSRAIRR